MSFYDFSALTTVPSLSATNAFTNIPSDCKIIVPDALYDTWISATNWSTYASYIIKKSEFYGSLTPQEITFTVREINITGVEGDTIEYTALDGMTWEEFCNSEYNDGFGFGSGKLYFEINGDEITAGKDGMGVGDIKLNGTRVKSSDTIISGGAYESSY